MAQLNTHKFEALLRLVAQQSNLNVTLGIKGKSGILHSIATRSTFLSEPTHWIRYLGVSRKKRLMGIEKEMTSSGKSFKND